MSNKKYVKMGLCTIFLNFPLKDLHLVHGHEELEEKNSGTFQFCERFTKPEVA